MRIRDVEHPAGAYGAIQTDIWQNWQRRRVCHKMVKVHEGFKTLSLQVPRSLACSLKNLGNRLDRVTILEALRREGCLTILLSAAVVLQKRSQGAHTKCDDPDCSLMSKVGGRNGGLEGRVVFTKRKWWGKMGCVTVVEGWNGGSVRRRPRCLSISQTVTS